MGGLAAGPQAPLRSSRPGEAVALLDGWSAGPTKNAPGRPDLSTTFSAPFTGPEIDNNQATFARKLVRAFVNASGCSRFDRCAAAGMITSSLPLIRSFMTFDAATGVP
jgi:hypothetical protein